MNFLSRRGGIGEIEYDLETEERIELSSTFLNTKTYLPLLKSPVQIKKQKSKHIMSQRNWGQSIRSPPVVRIINRKTALVFHYLAHVEKNKSELFCTDDIENTQEALDIYEKYYKIIPLVWPVCTSTDILRALPKLKVNLEKLKKYLLSTFYLLKKIYDGKKRSRRKKHKIFGKKTLKENLNFYLNKIRQEQIFLTRKCFRAKFFILTKKKFLGEKFFFEIFIYLFIFFFEIL